jgi:hypothetical protein
MMHTKVRSRRAAMLASASLAMAVALISPGTMVAARDFPDLPDYKLMLDSTWAWGISPGAENPADLSTPTGTWTVTPSPIADGILDLRVRLETPRVSLPVEAGPAVLYVTVALAGGTRGDVGFGKLVSVEPTFLPPCTGEPCAFEAQVFADLRRLPRMAGHHPRLTTVWAEIDLKLVRTFGDGAWLQELDYIRPNGTVFSGTLADPLRSMGATPQIGLFPAAGATAWREDGKRADMLDALHDDRLRSQDSSRAPATTDVRLVATFVDCANSDEDRDRDRMGASMLTADGDRVTFRRARGLDFIDEIVWLPVGSTWQVGWDWGQTAPFQVGSAPLLVTGTYRCTDDGVRLEDVAVGEVISSAEPGPSTSIGRGS